MNKNFAKTESYCLMNKFTPVNVGELSNRIKNVETYSELVKCLEYTDKIFAETESYCLMNKFTPENVGELLNRIKNAETYSEILRCLKYTDKIFMFDLFKITNNNDDYIDIETNTTISSISLMFSNNIMKII